MLLQSIRSYGRLIKFSHTIFALPFALSAVLLANREAPVTLSILFWVVVAMAAARSAAMGFNRLVDSEIDRKNPRTANRATATGEIERRSVILFVLVSSGAFVLAAGMLGKLCLVLSIPVLGVLFFYSLTKRFTAYSHLFLGFGIGLAPTGAWVAVTGSIDPRILLLSIALMTYIAGFDVLYGCQDIEFDTREGLFSAPCRWGVEPALRFSTLLHIGTFIALLGLALAFRLGGVYYLFLLLITALLAVEHLLVRPDRLDNVNIAFFHINSVVSVLLLVGVWLDLFIA